jgi:hypothetical protein
MTTTRMPAARLSLPPTHPALPPTQLSLPPTHPAPSTAPTAHTPKEG